MSALHSRASNRSLSSLFAHSFTNVISPSRKRWHCEGFPLWRDTTANDWSNLYVIGRGSSWRLETLRSTFEHPASSRLRTRSSCCRCRPPSGSLLRALHCTRRELPIPPLLVVLEQVLRGRLASKLRATSYTRSHLGVVAKLDFGLVGAVLRLGICPGMSTLLYLVGPVLP